MHYLKKEEIKKNIERCKESFDYLYKIGRLESVTFTNKDLEDLIIYPTKEGYNFSRDRKSWCLDFRFPFEYFFGDYKTLNTMMLYAKEGLIEQGLEKFDWELALDKEVEIPIYSKEDFNCPNCGDSSKLYVKEKRAKIYLTCFKCKKYEKEFIGKLDIGYSTSWLE